MPFNYLVIQSPGDTSVGKTSTFPWRNRKRKFHTLKLCRDGSINLSILLQNYVGITIREGGVGCPVGSVNQSNPFAAQVNPSILSAKCPFFPPRALYSSCTACSFFFFSPRKSLMKTVAKINPRKDSLQYWLCFFVAGNPWKKTRTSVVSS